MKTPLTLSRPGSFDIKLAAPGQRAQRIHGFVYMSEGSSNSYLITTNAESVLINTGLAIEAPVHKRAFEEISLAPIRYILITQGQADHVGGLDLFRTAHPDAVVIAQETIRACQADDTRIKEFRQRRNLRFFPEFLGYLEGESQPAADVGRGTAEAVAAADLVFTHEHRFVLDGIRFELHAVPGGETTDSTLVWLPDERLLFSGNALGPLFPHLPNLCTIRGDRLRFAAPYLEMVQKIIDLEPEVLITGHFAPVHGKTVIADELARLRDAVCYVHDRTIEGMNAGKDVFTLMREIRLPDNLEVGEDCGTVAWAVRAIYQGYAGWFQSRSTTELYGAPAHEVYEELAGLAGCEAMIAVAEEKLAAGLPLVALHLAEIVLARDDGHAGALDVYIEAHEKLLAESHSGNRWQKYWLEGEIARARAKRGRLE